jgi:outer membrane protein OmpA-like peptidoglycan-associated protein/Tol biopolymer transport system component
MYKFLLVVTLLVIHLCINAQGMNYSISNKKAIKLFEEALNAPRENRDQYGRETYTKAIELLSKALEKEPNFWEAYVAKAEMAQLSNDFKLAIVCLEKSLEVAPKHSPGSETEFMLGYLQFNDGKYLECKKNLEIFVANKRANPKDIPTAQRLIASSNFAIEALKHPNNYKPINLGPAINTTDPEYFPTITVDGKTVLFTRRIKDDRAQGPIKQQEDFYISHLKNNAWTTAEPMPTNINTVNNEGAPTIAADGRSLIFIACPDITGTEYGADRQGKGSCDMFITKKIGSRWTNAMNLPGMANTPNWETQPSLSSDGKTLYFIRSIRGQANLKNSDIYCTTLQEDGTWGPAVKLPNTINTPMEEESVLIHPDGKTLYFASKGHVGMGGSDLYMSRKDAAGNWSTPVNLGYPINTSNDENSLMVSPDGDIAFFASDREGGFGDLDIYYFEMPEEMKPVKTLYFEGLVFDAITKKPVPGKFQLIDVKTGQEVIRSEADQISGEFLVSLPVNQEYAVSVSYPGYSFYSKNFNLTIAEDQEAMHLDIPMVPLGSELPVLLANVFFDLNKTELRPESFSELNKLKDLLQKNTALKIEIGGHTDTRGDAVDNQKLSEGRANSVRNYLIQQGILADRLVAKGFGESQPIVSDDEIAKLKTSKEQEKAHQSNRRTEYKFLK